MGITSDVVEASGTGTALGGTRSEAVEISGQPMEIQPSKDMKILELSSRIDELNQKCTQVLLFLSFAIVAVALSPQRSVTRIVPTGILECE
jgi:hypothetical protein